MDNILERQRAAHEEIERLEQAIVDEYMQEAKTHRERLRSEHTVDRYLTRIADRSKQLCESYEDKEGLRQSEIEALTGSTEFSEFYERLRVIKDHHRKFPNEPAEPPELEFMKHKGEDEYVEEEEEDELEKLFTGEESYGRYLDLNALYTEYINLKGVKKLDYLQYLNAFDNFEATYPKSIKNSPEYRWYLKNLRDYLRSFFRRARPLYDLDRLESQARKEFEEKWANGTLAGWEDVAKSDPALYCEACQKTFTKQTVYDGHLKGKKHINNQKKLDEQKGAQATNGLENGNGNNNGNGKEDTRKNTAWKELLISKYTDVLSEFRDATRANVERKQALTDKERTLEQEQEEIEIGDQDTDEEDDDKIYNPLKLPLGWDGKPIPYWLYKLHGLGVEYPCEICGNYVYMGRKAFDKHFQEWRHAHGMRCLGIPNTRHFHEITKIEDAYALYEKLKKEGAAEDFIADQMEEYEDEEGNVFNKKTYEDLRRQGIL